MQQNSLICVGNLEREADLVGAASLYVSQDQDLFLHRGKFFDGLLRQPERLPGEESLVRPGGGRRRPVPRPLRVTCGVKAGLLDGGLRLTLLLERGERLAAGLALRSRPGAVSFTATSVLVIPFN